MMKKTIISTTIAVALSLSSATLYAADTEDWEKELNEVSKDFSNLDVQMSDISTLLSDSGASEEPTLAEMQAEKDNVARLKAEAEALKLAAFNTKKKLEIAKSKEMKNVVETAAINESDDLIEVVEAPKVVLAEIEKKELMSDETDFVFLRNIPEGTRFTVEENYTVLPKKKFIIFSGGERVMKTPQTIENPEAEFCFIELVNSGSARILKKGTPFTVTGNKTEVKEYNLNKSYGNYVLRTYQTVFSIDNKNVKNLTCYLSETYQKDVDKTPKPLTLKNLKDASGGVFKVEFPAYEEI